MTDIKLTINNKNVNWTEGFVKQRLSKIGSLEGKSVAWIRSDLSTGKSNWFTRMVWTVFVKYLHFGFLRPLYRVNLEHSKSLLGQIHNQLKDHPDLKGVFKQAVLKFNEVAYRHQFNSEGIPFHNKKKHQTTGLKPQNHHTGIHKSKGPAPQYKDWKTLIGEERSFTNAIREAVGGEEVYNQLPVLDLSKLGHKWVGGTGYPEPSLFNIDEEITAPIVKGINGFEGYHYLLVKIICTKESENPKPILHICFWKDGSKLTGMNSSSDTFSCLHATKCDDYYALFQGMECEGAFETRFRLAE